MVLSVGEVMMIREDRTTPLAVQLSWIGVMFAVIAALYVKDRRGNSHPLQGVGMKAPLFSLALLDVAAYDQEKAAASPWL